MIHHKWLTFKHQFSQFLIHLLLQYHRAVTCQDRSPQGAQQPSLTTSAAAAVRGKETGLGRSEGVAEYHNALNCLQPLALDAFEDIALLHLRVLVALILFSILVIINVKLPGLWLSQSPTFSLSILAQLVLRPPILTVIKNCLHAYQLFTKVFRTIKSQHCWFAYGQP